MVDQGRICEVDGHKRGVYVLHGAHCILRGYSDEND